MLKGYIDAYWVKNSNMKKSPNQNGKNDMYPEFWTHIYELG